MLYLERKKAADDSAKMYGVEITPEDSFFAQIDILSQDPAFAKMADDLYERYKRSISPEERNILMAEAIDLFDRFRVEAYGEDLVRQLSTRSESTNLGAFVSAEGVFSRYGYEITHDDIEILQKMLTEIHDFSRRLCGSYLTYSAGYAEFIDLFRMFKDPLTKEDFDKIAIAYVVKKNRLHWHLVLSPLRALFAIIVGGHGTVSDFSKRPPFCADLAVLYKILSDEMGYLAEVISVSVQDEKPVHQYVKFGDGSVYDPFCSPRTYGYRKDNPYEGMSK
jgi:hypothetical protein